MKSKSSCTRVELDSGILRDNIRHATTVPGGKASIVFVVKADAYGHGMAHIARCAFECGIRSFAVCHVDEAVALRKCLPAADILLIGVLSGEEAVESARMKASVLVVSKEHAKEISSAAAAAGIKVACHAKIDTGMGRLGFAFDSAVEDIASIVKLPGLAFDGICSHFASADMPADAFAGTQVARFELVIQECGRRGIAFKCRHISNSGGYQFMPSCDYDAVRLGILFYGYPPRGPGERVVTAPVLQWKTTVAQVKDVPAGTTVGYGSTHTTRTATRIAILNVGYSDGYPRLLGNKAHVLLGGRRVPVIGRISMNFTAVDAGMDAVVKPGDDVVLIGRQGGASIWADELASLCDTIPYEILTGISTCVRTVLPE